MEQKTIIASVNSIARRHVPYQLENGNLIIQNDIILMIDQLDNSICSCKATPNNFKLLGIIPASESSSSSVNQASSSSMLNTSDSEVMEYDSQIIDSQVVESKLTTKKQWSKDAILFLIDQWQKNSSKFASTTIRNEEVWKNIVKELEDAGFVGYSWKQAQDKWKNLRKAYMKVKDNKGDKSSGAARVTCKFYDELDEIFTKSPSVQPISTASSRNSKSLSDADTDSDIDKDLLKHHSIKKKTKLQRDAFTYLSILREDADARETVREERHQQTLNVLNRAIDTYETQMQKLIDKL